MKAPARLAASRIVSEGIDPMRVVLFVAILVAAAWAVDAIAFDGRFTQAAWQEAKYRGQEFNYEIAYFLRKLGLFR